MSPVLKNAMLEPVHIKKVHFEEPQYGSLVESIQMLLNGTATAKDRTTVQAFVSSDVEDHILIGWLQELNDNISIFEKKGENALEVIWNFQWYKKDHCVAKAYEDLALNLISAYPFCLKPFLRRILKVFCNEELCQASEEPVSNCKESFDCAHQLLQKLIALVPSAVTVLEHMVYEHFPYMRKDARVVLSYVSNLIHITSYVTEKKQATFELIVAKLLQIDVHCVREEITIEEFARCDNSTESSVLVEDSATLSMKHPLANLLDLLMEQIFAFTKESCYDKGSSRKLDWEATKSCYRMFLGLFDKLVLPTHAPSHVQFIIFYICSFDMRLTEGFFDYLWKKVLDLNTAAVLRQSAAAYIGSFLSRALYIPTNTTCTCLEIMCEWIHQYIDYQSAKGHVSDPSVHYTFYAVCQSVFYILIFHHKEIVDLKNGLHLLRNMNFDRMITSSLNPLRFCQMEVVKRFASLMRHYQLAYCYTVIEHNARCTLPVVAPGANGSNSDTTVSNFDTFFPFDPYLLKRSGAYIHPLYRVYVNNDITTWA